MFVVFKRIPTPQHLVYKSYTKKVEFMSHTTTLSRASYFERLKVRKPSVSMNGMVIRARQVTLKDVWARVASLAIGREGLMPDRRTPIQRFDSGNFPLYNLGSAHPRVRAAIIEASAEDGIGGAYLRGVDEARKTIAEYYGIREANSHHVFFCAGISDAILKLQLLLLRNTNTKMFTTNVIYPTHLATATMLEGSDSIVTCPRTSNGQPDLSHYSADNNPMRNVGLITVVPYENPLPVVHREAVYRNNNHSGIFDLVERATWEDGRLRPIFFDIIYGSFTLADIHLGVKRILELADGKHILIFGNSLSKVFMDPNKRGGVLAVYVPPELEREAEGTLIRGCESLFDLALNPVAYPSLRGLEVAHEILIEELTAPDPHLEAIRREARKRFIGEDGRSGNQRIMSSVAHLSPMFDLAVESSGYNIFRVNGEELPWTRDSHKLGVLANLRRMMIEVGNENAAAALDYYLSKVPAERIAPSDVFCADLFAHTGIVLPPVERFFQDGTAPIGLVGFRPVMLAETEQFRSVAESIGNFLSMRLD